MRQVAAHISGEQPPAEGAALAHLPARRKALAALLPRESVLMAEPFPALPAPDDLKSRAGKKHSHQP
jgi:hypothetical protein